MSALLTIENLSKSFRSYWTFQPIEALRNVSFEIQEGDTFGYLGHNGAGKTTTIKCILGLVHKSSGKILFAGEPFESVETRAQIGYLPELPYFYDHLTVRETLEFFASLCGKNEPLRVTGVLERVGLADRQRSLVRTLSKGLQQRLGFAQAIINEPRLLLLDEPFSGLDPLGRKELRELILEFNRNGVTVLLSSHILSDVEHICNRVSIMTKGEIRSVFDIKESAALFGERFELALALDPSNPAALELEAALANSANGTRDESTMTSAYRVFTFESGAAATEALHRALHAQIPITRFERVTPALEEIFMQVTQGSR